MENAVEKIDKLESPRAKPFLKWAGGKRQLLDELRARCPKSFRRYYEPFLGGGALFFSLEPSSAVLSDVNQELINAYEVVRDLPFELIEQLEKFENTTEQFYEVRAWDRESGFSERSPLERASRLIYLNKTCFNGLHRVNSKGQFNVPFGKYKNPRIANREGILASSSALKGVELLNQSFEDLEGLVAEGDFVYLDPPYVPLSTTSSFTSYAQDGFDLQSQEKLAELFSRLDKKGALLMLSNSSSSVVRELYSGFEIDEVQAKRSVNSNGKGRGAVAELIVRNYSTLQSRV